MAVVLPPGGGEVARRAIALARGSTRFRPVLVGMERDAPCPGIAYFQAEPGWFPAGAAARLAVGVGKVLEGLQPAVIEVHDQPQLTKLLARRFRPVPVVLVLHSDPQPMQGARDAAARTFLLAHATRAAVLDAVLRDRLLQGVHPSMRRCAVLPQGDGAAAALDALREDALDAWSRTLNLPI